MKCPEFLTDIQEQVIIGSLLGDGSLSGIKLDYRDASGHNKAINSHFSEKHCIEQLEYLSWKASILKDFCITVPNKINKRLDFQTCSDKLFTDLEKKWYKRDENGFYILNEKGWRIKIVPKDLVLTPLVVAIWYLDDGNLEYKSYQKEKSRRSTLYTYDFSEGECLFLVDRLKNLGIENAAVSKRIRNNKIYFSVAIRSSSFTDFLDIVKLGTSGLNVPSCMDYKYIITDYKQAIRFGEDYHLTKYSNSVVLEVIELANKGLKFKNIAELTKTNIGFVNYVLNRNGRKDIVGDKILKPSISRKNTSGTIGVTFDKRENKWRARITKNKITTELGYFDKKENAIQARINAEKGEQ